MVGPAILTGGVGIILNRLTSDVEGLITHAASEANVVAMTAGAELRKTIEDARIAYADSLNLTIDRVDVLAQRTINDLATLVDGIQQKNEQQLKAILRKVQTIANTIPFHNDRPQLTSIHPHFVVITQPNRLIRFNFDGNFEHASTNPLHNTLTFNNHTVTPIANNTNRLTFAIAASDVFDMNVVSRAGSYSLSTGELKLSWPGPLAVPSLSSIVGGIFRRILRSPATAQNKVETFRITVGALPPSPGILRLQYSTQKKIKEEQVFISESKHIDSCKQGPVFELGVRTGGHNKDEEMIFTHNAPEGWEIKPGSSTNGSILSPNDAVNTELKLVSETTKTATFLARTKHSSFGHSGIMDFTMKCTLWRDKWVHDQDLEDNISLGWGKEHTFTPKPNWTSWKVLFKPFDDLPHERIYQQNGADDRIQITPSIGSGFKITAKIPEELDE